MINIEEENEVINLLNYLLDSYREVNIAIKYGRETLTIKCCVISIEPKLQTKKKKGPRNRGRSND